ncbi:MAG: HipA domain-containing protein [Ignavibacteriales bacterium]|nr:HipA domain-containing protein [Ignavibacteriales bacterium]
MNICPIAYVPILQGQRYSKKGLRSLSRGLTELRDLPFTAVEQRQEAAARAGRMSIQGVQPKLSARLSVSERSFVVVDINGSFILKPQSMEFPELPENEDVTMRLAAVVGIEVPHHGLIFAKDGSMTYFIKRFDRVGKRGKLPVEDFAQLTGGSRDTKYDSSMEKVAAVIDTYCTFPVIEKRKLLRLTVFSFLVGNQDMHLKNFSLITRDDKVEMSPAYDLLNSSVAMPSAKDDLALPIRGKMRKLTRKDLIDYFGGERLGLRSAIIDEDLAAFARAFSQWENLIEISFLSSPMKTSYREIVQERRKRLGL